MKQSSKNIAARYAKSLFVIAQKEEQIAGVLASLESLKNTLLSEEFYAVISRPTIAKSDLRDALVSALKESGAHEIMVEFCDALAKNRRFDLLEDICAEFARLSRQESNILLAKITSAAELSGAERNELIAKLKAKYNKEIQIEESIDKSLLGGLTVMIESDLIDISLKSKVQTLACELYEAC